MGISSILKDYEMEKIIVKETGEVRECICMSEEDIIKVQEAEREAKKKYKEKQNEKYLIRNKDEIFGKFIGIYCNSGTLLEESLSTQDLFRLLYISTFLNYSGKLMATQRTSLAMPKLQELCSLKYSTWLLTKKVLIDNKYMYFNKTDIFINAAFAKMGKLTRNCSADATAIFRCISIKNVQTLYTSLEPSKHCIVGEIFRLIPYLNRCNQFCYNPMEKDYNKIEPISEEDFCKLLGRSIDKSNVRKFMDYLYSLKIGTSEFPIIKKRDLGDNKEVILLNPCIIKLIDHTYFHDTYTYFGYAG